MKSTFDLFSEGLYELSNKIIPESVYYEAKKCLLDYLGVTFAGAKELKDKSSHLLSLFDEAGNIPILGLDKKSTLMNAILLNGIHSHVIELDDGHRTAMMHPGAPIISALLPLSIQKKISSNAFLKGLILGYEASIKLASALQPSLKERGFHATGVIGAIGTAISIAVSLNCNQVQLKNAISAATSSASGILRVIKDVSELKPYNVGNAAQSGYTAAMLALSGFRGPYDVFDGDLGFLSMMSSDIKEEYLLFKERDEYSISKIYRKPYAACRHNHAPIEAALLLKNKYEINADKINKIDVKTYSLAVSGHDHVDIVGINSAKMSIPYSIAVALITNSAGINEFDNSHIQNNKIRELTKKVKITADADLSKQVPEKRTAILTLTMEDGTVFSEKVDYPKGEPENPLSDKELCNKFFNLTKFAGKTSEESRLIYDTLFKFEFDIKKLINLF